VTIRTLNPTYEEVVAPRGEAPRLVSLKGATVGLLDNSKRCATHFLNYVEEILRADHEVFDVVRWEKSNVSAPAPDDVMARLVDCDAMITAMGDCGSCSSSTLHDAVTAELAGTPAVAVITDAFVMMADVMAETCGIPGYRYAIIAHPVSSNSQNELRKKAQEVVHQSLELLTLDQPKLGHSPLQLVAK